MDTIEIQDDSDCDANGCGVRALRRQCCACGVSALICDCGHQAQPRPIAADGANDWCDACYDVGHTDVTELAREAGEAGDDRQAGICERALQGDSEAWDECVRVIRAARAARG